MAQNNLSDFNRDERTNRFRTINSTPQEEENLPPRSVLASSSDGQTGDTSRTSAQPSSPVNPLDQLRKTQQVKAVEEEVVPPSIDSKPGIVSSFKSFRINRKTKLQEAKPMVESTVGEVEPALPSRKMRLAPAFWTIASTLSIVVNLILIIVLFFLLNYVSKLNIQINELLAYASLPEDTVKGLYENFVLMDSAHIRTQIPVSLEVPVKFDITINTQTEVTLSQDTPITQARVTLSTGGLNINNAPANIVLPAGTRLPINLSLVVPVDKTVPVSLVVPVDIALKDTDLHTPFVGLQQVIQPLYCLLDPQATSSAGLLLCPPPPSP